ncbi:MAG: molybdenum cofactor guanylyltransferase [Proteobacteria bacterium]|nr:molybdenum cofactor guanylyltransferase [Pseudomonadota bacterium]
MKITGIILCGGRGSRLGGQDKPLLAWRGKALIAHVIERLTPQTDSLLISANRNLQQYAAWAPVMPDQQQDFSGPLAGILAALSACNTDLAVICPGDGPLLPGDLVERLAGIRKAGEIAVAHDGERLQPLYQLLETKSISALAAWCAGADQSVTGWLNSQPHSVVDFSDRRECFRNINQLADLESGV